MADAGGGSAPPANSTPEDSGGAQMKVQQKKQGCMKSFCAFLYNPTNGTVMGRGGVSWLKIFIFYVIFYIVVFAFFFMLLIAFYQTVNEHRPRLVGEHSLLAGNPGLGFAPRPDETFTSDTALIWYDRTKPEEYERYVKQLTAIVEADKRLKDRNNKDISRVPCTITTGMVKENEVCIVYASKDDNETVIKEKWGPCTVENNFGYPEGSPCILIRLNRLIDWVPKEIQGEYTQTVAYKELTGYHIDDIPKEQIPNMEDIKKYVWLTCDGVNFADQTLRGNLAFYPTDRPGLTIPNHYFPFSGQPAYLAPFVMLHLQDPVPGALIQIRCTAYNENIVRENMNGLGTVKFEILIDTDRG